MKKYNVLFIMTDQHNVNALGCYGNSEVKTPIMDKLAKEGVLFEKAYCQTGQCCPSRYSIWTGRFARSHGLYANSMMENPEEVTVADLFSDSDYVTGTIGKHHMHMNEIPDKHGFDIVIDDKDFKSFIATENTAHYDIDGRWLPDYIHPGRSSVGASNVNNEHTYSGFITSQTIKFIQENKDRPFCLWYSFFGPHTPITPSEPWASMYDPEKLTLPPNNCYEFSYDIPGFSKTQTKSGEYNEEYHRKTLAYYYGLVSQIDYNIGLVLDELKRLELADNTIVVYTTDHGDMSGEHGCWTKGLHGYDATLHIPMIIKLPGVLPEGMKTDELVCSIDLLPTLLDLTGHSIPEYIQGKSLTGLMRGNEKNVRKVAFSEIGHPDKITVITAIGNRYKYVLYRQKHQIVYEQFFDKEHDPWEMKNEIDNTDYLNAISSLKRDLQDWETNTVSQPISDIPESGTMGQVPCRSSR
jgi:arylsulfatase A-like enzyme